MSVKALRRLAPMPLALMLGGCHMVLLNPAGDVARQQSHLLVVSVLLMLLIIVPVLVAIAVVAWRYRASNKQADYSPDWEHSTQLELLIWAAPLIIIIMLGAVTWIGTHKLDPYRPLDRVDASHQVTADAAPLRVQVVSLDWKWLFFYPDYGIATVNQLAAPVNVPITFELTSDDMMNSFFIPDLAGQIYAMPGMQTVMHAVINQAGDYKGFSANYSGHGFTDMRFRFVGMTAAHFKQWVQSVRQGGGALDRQAYLKLAQPTRGEPVHHYARYAPDLYHRILNRCVNPGEMCMDRMAAMDGVPPHDAAAH